MKYIKKPIFKFFVFTERKKRAITKFLNSKKSTTAENGRRNIR